MCFRVERTRERVVDLRHFQRFWREVSTRNMSTICVIFDVLARTRRYWASSFLVKLNPWRQIVRYTTPRRHMMAPERKIHTASKIHAKKARVSGRDPMVELEEGLFRLTTQCNAMDAEDHSGPVFYDPMELDWIGLVEALIMAIFPPPGPLLRSQADFPPPCPLIRSQADDLPSAVGIV